VSNKLWYSWNEMRRDVNILCREIVLDKFDPQVIVGLSRGGLVPGVMMSHWFQKPFKPIKAALRDFPEWEDYLPKKSDRRILIVDDICDSGETFERMKDYLLKNAGFSTLRSGIVNRAHGIDIKFASLCKYTTKEINALFFILQFLYNFIHLIYRVNFSRQHSHKEW